MALHSEGGLVITGRDVIHVRDGESRTLYSDSEIAGLNDLTVDPAGALTAHAAAGETWTIPINTLALDDLRVLFPAR